MDRPRGRARQPGPNPSRHQWGRGGGRARGADRAKPHARTAHEVDPRKAAYETLRRMEPGERMEPAVFATLRHMGTDGALASRVLPQVEDAIRFALLFDHLISHVATRPIAELDRDVRAALHMFLAWLIHDPRAAYAHGNAAVDLLTVKHAGRGFVNACARKLSDFVRVEDATHEDYPGAAERGETLPLWTHRCRLGDGRMLVGKHAIFPDPARELAVHLSVTCGIPRLLADKLLDQHGAQAATQAAVACIERPLTWIRPNPLFAENFHLPQWWTAQGISVTRHGEVFALPARVRPVSDHPDFARGGFYVQDWAAQQVAPMLQAQAGELILDLCSAPGGKAGHIAELTGDKAKILACDLSTAKEERIRENITRMGYRGIATVVADAATVSFPEKFDRVLIDAPCSNSGVLGRRVEARHRITEKSLSELAELQHRILENAAANLKPGGVILYSVCSILMEEGVDVVHRFMGPREKQGWLVEEERHILPVPAYHDGGYICRLKAHE